MIRKTLPHLKNLKINKNVGRGVLIRPLEVGKISKNLNINKRAPSPASMKGKVMQIERALISDRLRVSKVSYKFCILTIYVSIVFSG